VAAARARPTTAVGIGVAVVAAVAAALLVLRPHSSPPPLVLPKAPHAAAPATTAPAGDLVVDVAGAIVRHGVVRVGAGSRVGDALAAAGGPSADADLDQVNLAARVSDGERVYVPRRGEAVPPPQAAAPGSDAKPGPVDLNTATADQLDTLPGVGPATASAIIEYRTRHGRFRSVDDLLDVPGIGPAKLASLRPRVRT
jgi:competence protein ComEA